MPTSGPIVLGILYPLSWSGEAAAQQTIETVRSLDPRIEVIVEPYVEPQELRAQRGTPDGAAQARAQALDLTEAQREMFGRVHGVLTLDLPFDVGTVAPALAWVQAVGAGTGQLQSAGLAEAGIRLTSAAGMNAVSIAEFVVGRILEDRKRFGEIRAAQAEHTWRAIFGGELAGTTIGLIGYGAIASNVAKRLAAFDVRILTTRRSGGAPPPNVGAVFRPEQLHDMLAQCDTVVAAVPETPETIGLMDAAAFRVMPEGSFFVNVGRGSLVDEPALIDALERGHLRGAALDVASIEPLPPDHPLWNAPNLSLSAHCSSSPATLFPNLHRLWIENVRRWLRGEELLNDVALSPGTAG